MIDVPLKPIDRTTATDAFDRVYATERSSAERERLQAVGKQKKKKHEENQQHAEPEDRLEVSGLTNEEQECEEEDNAEEEQENELKPEKPGLTDSLDLQA